MDPTELAPLDGSQEAGSGQDESPLLSPWIVAGGLAKPPGAGRRRLLWRLVGATFAATALAVAALAMSSRGPNRAAHQPGQLQKEIGVKEQYGGDVAYSGYSPAPSPFPSTQGSSSYYPAPTPAPSADGSSWVGAAPTPLPFTEDTGGYTGYSPTPSPTPSSTIPPKPHRLRFYQAPTLVPQPAAQCTAGGSSYVPTAPGGTPSIYCFALVMPGGSEVDLLQYQLQTGISLFSCDEYQVFSNISFELGPDPMKGNTPVPVIPIGISLEVPHGGRWGTALNTDVFVRLWQVVAQQCKWQQHDWSVKLDADAVFLPQRLTAMLRSMPNPGAKYLNNCKWGMHGPIEVVAHGALEVFFSQMEQCEGIRNDAREWQPVHWNVKMKRWTGTDEDHSFGEDQYFRRCMRLLHVTVVNEYKLLDELACGGDPKHTGCVGNYVTYHPFKDIEQYRSCLAYAQAEEANTLR